MSVSEENKKETESETEPENENIISGDPDVDLTKENIYQKAFMKIGIQDRYCCKRHMLAHIDLIQKI